MRLDTASSWRYRLLDLVAALAIATAAVTLADPLLHSGFPIGHDLEAHLTYTYLFDRALEAGQFPVRWTQGVRTGDTQPLFNFYQPGFYYLVQLVHVIVPSLASALKHAVLLLWMGGAAFVYALNARRGWMPAALAAVVFAGAPYLLLDVNVRSAYPELAAIMCAVGVLWALDRLFDAPGAGRAAWLGLLLAGALVCHLPATLIFAPVFGAYALRAGVTTVARRRAALWCGAAVLVAIGLSAFYVMPAIGERYLIQIDALTQGYYDYQNHFVEPSQWLRFDWGFGSSVRGPGDGMSFQVGLVQWGFIGAAAVCCLVSATRRRLTREDWDLVFWLGVVAFALFMTTSASTSVWHAVPQMAYLQFPWRFLMLVAVACSFLVANLVARIDSPRLQPLAVAITVVVLLAASHDQRQPVDYLPRRAMDIDQPDWRETPEAQKSAFVEPGYSPARGHAGQAIGGTSLRHWANVSSAATGAVLLVLVAGAGRPRELTDAGRSDPGS